MGKFYTDMENLEVDSDGEEVSDEDAESITPLRDDAAMIFSLHKGTCIDPTGTGSSIIQIIFCVL